MDRKEQLNILEIDNLEVRWGFCNEILYEMCANNPDHSEKEVFFSKLLIIGRTYAAAIERVRNSEKNDNDAEKKSNQDLYSDFYYNKLGKDTDGWKVDKFCEELDKRMQLLKKYSVINENNISNILELHNFFVTELMPLTTIKKTSLASKYLHFHLPNLFYICDSRGRKRMNAICKDETFKKFRKASADAFWNIKRNLEADEFDKTYYNFFEKAYDYQIYLRNHGKNTCPRMIDNILLAHTYEKSEHSKIYCFK